MFGTRAENPKINPPRITSTRPASITSFAQPEQSAHMSEVFRRLSLDMA